MKVVTSFLISALPVFTAAEYLLGIPTVPFAASGSGTFDALQIEYIIADTQYEDVSDLNGSTLIPPTLYDFATTFAKDLSEVVSKNISIVSGSEALTNSIFLTLSDPSTFLDAAGRPTSEGYSLNVTEESITITGASPLGVWWGTRTVLQQYALNNGELELGSSSDSPGWATRGVMLDAGRHYYPKEFLVEMCAYLSFFKQNTFHLHISDNLYNNVDIYSEERTLSLYAAFRLLSDDAAVAGLNKRTNESYTRDDFDYIQYECAARGVTIIPEIEAPGHALVITQWKPELGLSDDLSLLNISNPDTIPTVERIWETFLPWFHSKIVHIGADEYVDASISKDALVEEYTLLVNSLNTFIRNSSDKSVRIWGTFTPSVNATNVDQTVSIQHWEYFEDNPLFDYINNGYDVLNSDDAFYIVGKWSGSYPQKLNISHIFHGAPDGGAYAPNIFDTTNATNNPARDDPRVLGQVAAQWNDYGPNATVYTEAYYSWRDGLPALADKQWGGVLLEDDYARIFAVLHAAVPGQNLDRSIPSRGATIVSYDFTATEDPLADRSGNGYDAVVAGGCEDVVAGGGQPLQLTTAGCGVETPLGSKGRNYMLLFSIRPTSAARGPVLTGPDSALWAGNGSSSAVMLVAGGNAFALNYTFPEGRWTNASLEARGPQTFLSVMDAEAGGPETEMEFTTTLGINGAYFVWAPIAVEAPLRTIGGGGFEGELGYLHLTA